MSKFCSFIGSCDRKKATKKDSSQTEAAGYKMVATARRLRQGVGWGGGGGETSVCFYATASLACPTPQPWRMQTQQRGGGSGWMGAGFVVLMG